MSPICGTQHFSATEIEQKSRASNLFMPDRTELPQNGIYESCYYKIDAAEWWMFDPLDTHVFVWFTQIRNADVQLYEGPDRNSARPLI
jgi:hypothetical protein